MPDLNGTRRDCGGAANCVANGIEIFQGEELALHGVREHLQFCRQAGHGLAKYKGCPQAFLQPVLNYSSSGGYALVFSPTYHLIFNSVPKPRALWNV